MFSKKIAYGQYLQALLLRTIVVIIIASGNASAQSKSHEAEASYPAKPIRFIIPFPPGGATDLLSRVVGQALGSQMGQTVVADNRPGATGNIGLDLLAKAPADGYTISLASSAATISATLYPNLPYNPLRDFAPITEVAAMPSLLITPAALPATTLQEFIALVKLRPGYYNYGSGGIGATNHIMGELFNMVAHVKLVHIPYKSTVLALTDMVSNQVHMVFIGPPAVAPYIQSGRLRALAVVYNERISAMPNVPTATEAGLRGLDAITWYGIVAPAGTSPKIVSRLNHEIVLALKSPQINRRMEAVGAIPQPMTSQEFSIYIHREVEKWAKVIKYADIKAQ